MQSINQTDRKVFVLRCWQAGSGSAESRTVSAEWRFALEPIDGTTEARVGFADLPELIAFLSNHLDHQTTTDAYKRG